jgi:O-antigen ligase
MAWTADQPQRSVAAQPATTTVSDVSDPVRLGTLVGALGLLWIGIDPFLDLSDVRVIQATEEGSLLKQLVFVGMAAFVMAIGWTTGLQRLRPILSPLFMALLGWLVVSVVMSVDPGISVRRFGFTVVVMMIGAGTLIIARDVRQFAQGLGIIAMTALVISYIGVLLLPDISIHSVWDVKEPEHDGSWRGLFHHKNGAGGMTVLFIFIGILVSRVWNAVFGGAIIVLSAVFLSMTWSKTAWALFPIVLAVSLMVPLIKPLWLRFLMFLGPFFALHLLSVGTVVFPPVKDIVALFLRDTSFTGRTDIWELAFEYFAKRPWTGMGFAAFWQTEEVMYAAREKATWATAASSAHNGFVDILLTAGIPGVVLAVLWFALTPVWKFQAAYADPASRPLAVFFLQVWLFVLYSTFTESVLFDRANSLWFSAMLAVFGLHMMAAYRTVR